METPGKRQCSHGTMPLSNAARSLCSRSKPYSPFLTLCPSPKAHFIPPIILWSEFGLRENGEEGKMYSPKVLLLVFNY